MEKTVRCYLSAYHEEVTGSRFLLNVIYSTGESRKILIDCGYFQEEQHKILNYLNDIDYSKIDAIFITHSHVDHIGLLPKAVKEGFNGKIYMSSISRELVYDLLMDSAAMQSDNCRMMLEQIANLKMNQESQDDADKNLKYLWYDNDAEITPLYNENDVKKTTKLCEGIDYEKEIEIFPGIFVTFYQNGHLLGASCIHVRISEYKCDKMNFFFTGDYKDKNIFFKTKAIPKKVRNLKNLTIVTEATYGTTNSDEIELVFHNNIAEACKERKNILIGAFAQGRMQEILYELNCMKKGGIIPAEYQIYYGGYLGICMTYRYQKILNEINPSKADFMPEELRPLVANPRNIDFSDGIPKIFVTTSGMMSNGPAKEYVPVFIERSDCLIHTTGYAAKDTIARSLIDAEELQEITIRGVKYTKRATVKATKQFSSHATADKLIEMLKKFQNPMMIIINHSENGVSQQFAERVKAECCSNVAIANRENVFCFYAMQDGVKIKTMTSKIKTYQLPKKKKK